MKILNQLELPKNYRENREIAKNCLKIQKRPFFMIFQKFQKHVFSTKSLYQNAKFGGPGFKNGHFRAKNVIFRISVNIDKYR